MRAQLPACYFPAEALEPGFVRMVGWHSRRVHQFTHTGNRTAAAVNQGAPLQLQLGEQHSCCFAQPVIYLHAPSTPWPALAVLCMQWLSGSGAHGSQGFACIALVVSCNCWQLLKRTKHRDTMLCQESTHVSHTLSLCGLAV